MLHDSHDKRRRLTYLGFMRVPNSAQALRTLIFTSARMEPSSVSPSHEPTSRGISLSFSQVGPYFY